MTIANILLRQNDELQRIEATLTLCYVRTASYKELGVYICLIPFLRHQSITVWFILGAQCDQVVYRKPNCAVGYPLIFCYVRKASYKELKQHRDSVTPQRLATKNEVSTFV